MLGVERLPEHAQQALSFSLNHLSEREAVFSEQDILKEALKAGMGKTTFPHIQHALEKAKTNGTLIEAGNERFTTPLALATEKSIIDHMLAGKNAVHSIDDDASFWKLLAAPFSKQQSIEAFLQNKSLTTGQKVAAEMILTTQDRILGIQGYAGTGKTHMLHAVKEYAEQKGFQLVGLSPKADAAKELQGASGIPSKTLSLFLTESEKQHNLSRTEPQEPRTVFVLDESSMASNAQLEKLLTVIKQVDARVVLVGDVQQLGAIEAGKPFAQLQKAGMQVAVMQDIQRQKNQQLLAAVYDSIKGQYAEAFKKIENHTYEIENKDDRLKALAETYLKLSPTERNNTLVLAPANADRIKLNEMIRAGLKEQGHLNNQATTAPILINRGLTSAQRTEYGNYHVGDVIRANRTINSLQKNTYYHVQAINAENKTLTFTDDKGQSITFQPHRGTQRSGSIEVYETQNRDLSVGDKITWRRNDKAQGILNSGKVEVTHIKNNQTTVRLENGKELTLDLNNPKNQHWDHGYASTVHAAQGKTCDKVLVHADSTNKYLTHQRSFYVELSRAKHEAHFFTDNKAQLLKTLEKYTGEKTSAMELINQFAVSAPKEQQVSKGMGISL
ncbi:MAG: AAA family ATPase [Gammaproteobacteria bacterium]|nr:AAA family ATPase [Gammaproteobacteria bacterium]